MAAKAETFVTFAVTFRLPSGHTIAAARQAVKDSVYGGTVLQLNEEDNLKVHLTNKEVKYGKR